MRVKLKHTDISNLDDAQTSENPQKFGCYVWSSCIRRTWRDHIKASFSNDSHSRAIAIIIDRLVTFDER